ncbi:hypothetical protein PPL_05569 [Heterostelium album PN500]|uniref:Uncharacterized protein n=1 Tax=Heterostelium pallidum (strain ATCC 26659 / Pp 5 / PN500) TaxID=670386 RepID=D3BAJ1_HETP5|nr:hypothetical protein PPL_05569 [Heterostelium album PN500]EFA81578.1 hypothetical protein PPL_05569 [Heterostelium album PN500]|eukprot:XP_020433695.1 hypothetical protein PPL_05569 [Heterostelium album PN500]
MKQHSLIKDQPPTHLCNHDSLIETLLQISHFDSYNNNHETANHKSRKSVKEIKQRESIKFDSSQIVSDPYACRHEGDRVVFGVSGNSGLDEINNFAPCVYLCKDYDVVTPEMLNLTDSIVDTIDKIFTSLLKVDRERTL